MKILTGNSNKNLSHKISKYLKNKLVNSSIRKFSDGEIYIEINENIRGNSIFIIQSVSSPANDNLMELLLCIDALKRSSAKNPGFISGIFLIFYSTFRFLIEFLRIPDEQLGYVLFSLSMGQILCLVFFIFGSYLILKKYDHQK